MPVEPVASALPWLDAVEVVVAPLDVAPWAVDSASADPASPPATLGPQAAQNHKLAATRRLPDSMYSHTRTDDLPTGSVDDLWHVMFAHELA